MSPWQLEERRVKLNWDIGLILIEKNFLMAPIHSLPLWSRVPVLQVRADEDIPTIHATPSVNNSPSNVKKTNQAQVFDGPITHSRAKKLQQEANSLLCEIYFNINENYILPKSCTLLLLGFTKEDNMNTKKTTEKHNTQTRPVLQNSMKEAIITFNPQKL